MKKQDLEAVERLDPGATNKKLPRYKSNKIILNQAQPD